MRYFLVSLLLNLALLFLPLNSRLIEDPKKDETMRIKLSLSEDTSEKDEAADETQPQILPAEPMNIPQPQEFAPPQIPSEPEPIKFQEPEPVKPEPPEPIKEEPVKKELPPPKPELKKAKKQPPKEIPPKPKFQNLAAAQSSPAQTAPNAPSAKPAAKNNASQSGGDQSVCKEGVGFKIEREPETKYPKKAIMLRLEGKFKVEVDFKFDGEIKILAVRGENKIFNDEAVKITKNLEIKVLKDISHCVITKPYEFQAED